MTCCPYCGKPAPFSVSINCKWFQVCGTHLKAFERGVSA